MLNKILKILSNKYYVPFITGLLFFLAFPPVNFYLLSFVFLIPFLYRLNELDKLKDKLIFTYLSFLSVNFLLLYWVGSWQKEADTFLMIGGTVLIFFNPITFFIPIILFHLTEKIYSKKLAVFLLPFFWVFYEYIYSITDLRFPWLSLANSIPYFTSFIQISNIVTAYGLTFIIVLSNVLLFLTILKYQNNEYSYKKYIVSFFVIFILINFYGFYSIYNDKSDGNTLKIKVVQPNLNPWDKWNDKNIGKLLQKYLTLSTFDNKFKPDVIIWPETALPVYFLSLEYSQYVNNLRNFVDTNNVYLITGMPHFQVFDSDINLPKYYKTSPAGYKYATYNSILEFLPNQYQIPYYGKQKLVPFGEKVPYVEYLPFLGDWINWNVGISSWNEGEEIKLFKVKNDSLAAVVCYESIFPDFIAKFFQKKAGALIVVTNDSWYGNSSGPYQHQAIAILRAVENHKPVVRCANGGISSYILPNGQEVVKTQIFISYVLNLNIKTDYTITFATKYPLIFPLLSIFVSLYIVLVYLYFRIFKK
jgi:apolipoprotein N-acyltransferase